MVNELETLRGYMSAILKRGETKHLEAMIFEQNEEVRLLAEPGTERQYMDHEIVSLGWLYHIISHQYFSSQVGYLKHKNMSLTVTLFQIIFIILGFYRVITFSQLMFYLIIIH